MAASQPSITVPAGPPPAWQRHSSRQTLYLLFHGMMAGLCSPPPPLSPFLPLPGLPIRRQSQPRQVLDRILPPSSPSHLACPSGGSHSRVRFSTASSPPHPPPTWLPIRRQPQPRQVLDRIVELAEGSAWRKDIGPEQETQVLRSLGGASCSGSGSPHGTPSGCLVSWERTPGKGLLGKVSWERHPDFTVRRCCR